MQIKFGVRFLFALLLPAAVLSGNQVVDSFNVGQPQAPNTFWGVTDIGWYYTPSTSYSLVQFLTEFTQSTDPGDINRSVTVGIFTDRPAVGGVLLSSATFNSSVARGVLGGATFSTGIALTGGTTYFVGLENVSHLGVNEVSFNFNGGAGPTGSVAPGATYQDSGGAAFGTQGSNGTTWFDKPVMEFLGPNPVQGTPEPASFLLLTAPMALMLVRRFRLR